MNRFARYAVASFVGVAVTVGVALVSPVSRVLLLLVGIAQVYGFGTAIAFHVPELFWGPDESNWVNAVFVGVLTFSGFALLSGVESGLNVAVATLGWGLAMFGFVAGAAFERERADS